MSTDTPLTPPLTRTTRISLSQRTPPALLAAIVAASAVLAMFSDASPTGHDYADAVWTGLFAGLLALAAAYADRWTWIALGGTAAIVAEGSLAQLVGIDALLVVLAATFLAGRPRWIGAIIGALAAQALLRGHSYAFTGLPTFVAAAACTPVFLSGYLLSPARFRKVARTTLAAAAVVIIPLGLYTTISAMRAEDRLLDAIDLADEAIAAASDGDEVRAESLLVTAGNELDDVAVQFNRPWIRPARLVPVLGQHASALHGLADVGADAADRAAAAVVQLDTDQLQAGAGRIDVAKLDELVDSLHHLFVAVGVAQDELAGIDRTWLVPSATRRMEAFDDQLVGRFGDAEAADAAASAIPDLLGANGPRSFLVMFLTPAESRGLGGFAGNWAELTADNGELSLAASGRSNELNEALPPGGVGIRRELLDLYAGWRLPTKFQNLPVVPDLPTVADLAADFYGVATGRAVDGVITIDHAGMAGLVTLGGPVTIDGRTLNAGQVEQFVLRDQYIFYDGDQEGRLAALDELTEKAVDQLIGGDLPSPKRLVDVLKPLAETDHIRLTTFDDTTTAALEGIGLNDAFPTPEGQDLLAVVTQNTGENKIDIFLQRSLEYQATINPDTGDVTARIKISLSNAAPSEGLPGAIIGNNDQEFGFGTNRMRVYVYTPLTLQFVSRDGFSAEMTNEPEFGWNRYRTTLWIEPGQTQVLVLDLIGQLDVSDGYVLMVEHQPMVNPDTVELDLRSATGTAFERTSGVDSDGKITIEIDADNIVEVNFTE